MTMSVDVRRLLGSMCFVLGTLFATLFLAGRALFRRRSS